MTDIRIGTAGWAIPRAVADAFPAEGAGLQRYSARLNAAEINASFYRAPRPQTLARWAETTPPHFRFAVKAPKAITHEAKLINCGDLLDAFVGLTVLLGEKLGPILVQLPPSLAFEPQVAADFFGRFRAMFDGLIACEPRHPSWFEPDADAMLQAQHVARVAADPARCPPAAEPGGWRGLDYWRLHGSPRMYWSAYEAAALDGLASALHASPANEAWCVFDNTASGAAAANALALTRRLGEREA